MRTPLNHSFSTEFHISQNMFWSLYDSDPYRALSFDRLHVNNLGVFKDHLWGRLKEMVQEMSRETQGKVDTQ